MEWVTLAQILDDPVYIFLVKSMNPQAMGPIWI